MQLPINLEIWKSIEAMIWHNEATPVHNRMTVTSRNDGQF